MSERDGQRGFTKVYVFNGPNLNRLGTREPLIYGPTTYADLVALCETTGKELGLDVDVRQTNAEHELIGWLHDAADEGAAVVLNGAAWTHYSIAVRDACSQLTGPLVEVHISNIHAREAFREHSVISAVATGVIVGFGVDGYRLALLHLANRQPKPLTA
ncbi:type II 3-dehydroquinate dehydratase [Longispora sp. K20-0274]|uniref:type II 3-dehydroquinate dehydratase n=1 Tax=Longispora sp. K20-0274 TaxID=3088255 RepID=UPI00399BE399